MTIRALHSSVPPVILAGVTTGIVLLCFLVVSLPAWSGVKYINDTLFAEKVASAVHDLVTAGKLRAAGVLLRTVPAGKPSICLAPTSETSLLPDTIYSELSKTVLVHCKLCRDKNQAEPLDTFIL